MDNTTVSLILAGLVFAASVISIEFGISVAIVELALGVIGSNLLSIKATPWIDFLAGFGSIVLTFLAGAEVDTKVMKAKFKESFLIGFASFLLPAVLTFIFCYYAAGWTLKASEIAGVALSTTSLAVVYAVLVETGLTNTTMGKILMSLALLQISELRWR